MPSHIVSESSLARQYPNPRKVNDLMEASDQTQQRKQSTLEWTAARRNFFQRKYRFDRVVGFVLLVGFSPLILLLWALVKLTSRGPGFYRQARVGLNRKQFHVVKIRSMRVDAEANGQAVWCCKGDDRVTATGKVLRSLHLDELPQLLNVVRGEMSLIGPRPERPSICEDLEQHIPDYFDRVMVKPGISGLSQINLCADESIDDVRRKQILDLNYINETNFWLEFRILLATVLRLVGIKGESIISLLKLNRRSLLDKTPGRAGLSPAAEMGLTHEDLQILIPQPAVKLNSGARPPGRQRLDKHQPSVNAPAAAIFPHIASGSAMPSAPQQVTSE